MNSELFLKENTDRPARDPALDQLRILAILLVVLTHVSAQWLDSACTASFPVLFFTELCSILSFAGVTLFVMLSGALLLAPGHREKSCSARFVLRRSLHYFLLYLFWKCFYLAEECLLNPSPVRENGIKEELFLAFFRRTGKYHLWYLPMFCLLLLLLPLLYEGAQKKSACLLYLALFAVTAICLPTLFLYEFPFKYLLMDFQGLFDFSYFLGYLGYFLLGHILYQYAGRLQTWVLTLLWALSLGALAAAASAASLRSLGQDKACTLFSTPFVWNTFLLVTAVFLTICRRKPERPASTERSNRTGSTSISNAAGDSVEGERPVEAPARHRTVAFWAQTAFGVYLLHPFFLDLMVRAGFTARITNPVLGIPVLWVLLTAVSFLAAEMLRKVPGIRKLLG